jgi:MiaB/RimO family radical SAM methylthiotransferase
MSKLLALTMTTARSAPPTRYLRYAISSFFSRNTPRGLRPRRPSIINQRTIFAGLYSLNVDPCRNTDSSYLRYLLNTAAENTSGLASRRFFSHDRREKRSSFLPDDGLSFGDFVVTDSNLNHRSSVSSEQQEPEAHSHKRISKTFHIKTYGCQMNINDTQIVRSILLKENFTEASIEDEADILLTNTCSIREKAETKVFQHLRTLRKRKGSDRIVGLLGCMAERLQQSILDEGLADVVVGPDAYRNLPKLLFQLFDEDDPMQQAIDVQLSKDETYSDILPVQESLAKNDKTTTKLSAFASIQRGCDNRCSFCIVPFTRGKERSRPLESIVDEITHLRETDGIQEIILLGQNVNSYHDRSEAALQARPTVPVPSLSNQGFRSRTKRPTFGGHTFVDLLERVSDISPELRVRFTSPHPKNYPTELLSLMNERANICNQIHLPAQSGSTTTLQRMKRGYSREAYLELVHQIWDIIPDVALSSDFIAGFCDETEEEHKDTVSLLQHVQYEQAFLFAYSLREKTYADRRLEDNVPPTVKQSRLQELIDTFRREVHKKNERIEVGKFRLVLVEGKSKRQDDTWSGRTDQNKRIFFPVEGSAIDENKVITRNQEWVRFCLENKSYMHSKSAPHLIPPMSSNLEPGEYAVVQVTEAKGHTLRGNLLWQTTLSNFAEIERRFLADMRKEELERFQDVFDNDVGKGPPPTSNIASSDFCEALPRVVS